MERLRRGPLPNGSSENFVKRSARFVARKAAPLFLTMSLAACGGGEKISDSIQPQSVPRPNESGALPNPENPFAVLEMPFPKDPKMAIQQGWTSVFDPKHHGIDFVKGDIDNSRTWKSFPVKSAADGKACANPSSREGNAVLITHGIGETPIGSTYYGHLQKSEKDIPECSTGQTVFKGKGYKIGDAGSDGAQDQSWIHLHFQVNDANGNPIDPYDLEGERSVYPKPDFSDVKEKPCGPTALFIDCYPKGAVVASPKDATPPISGKVNEKSTTPTAKPAETKKPEVSVHREGILPIESWQFEVQNWKESDYQTHYNFLYDKYEKIYREGWKYVAVSGRVRNMGAALSTSPDLENFYILSKDNNKHETKSFSSSYGLPPGFSEEAGMAGWVPQNQSDYVITYDAPQGRQLYKVKKGEIANSSPVVSPEVQTNEINKPWTIPSFGEITYNNKTVVIQGNRLEDLTVDRKKYRIYQYISLNLQNNTGQDISPTSLSFVIFSKSGDIIEGERATKEGLEPPIVAPGLKKTFYVYVPIEDTKKIEEEIKGGILVGIINNNNWFVWQLP